MPINLKIVNAKSSIVLDRWKLAKVNILASLLIKGANILLSFIIIKIVLELIGEMEYGVWLVINSLNAFMNFFDLGLGNGLRNHLSEAMANNNFVLAKKLVSTTYFILFVIVVLFFLLYILISHYINWYLLFNVKLVVLPNLATLMFYVVSFFFINFYLRLITSVIYAFQLPALNDSIFLFTNLLSFTIIYTYKDLFKGNLTSVVLLLSCSPVIILFFANIGLFLTRYSKIRPNIKFVRMPYAKKLFGLGSKFLIAQSSVFILYYGINFIVANICDLTSVTYYNLSYKYFSIISLVFGTIIAPFWNAYNEAYIKNEIIWIRTATKRILKIWVVFVIITIALIMLSSEVFEIWVGNSIKIPFIVSVLMGLFTIVFNWNAIFGGFLNGLNMLKVSIITSLTAIIIFLFLSFLLGKVCDMKLVGILIALLVSLLPTAFFLPKVFYNKINSFQFSQP